ncbi:hypothetical protein C0991_006574, partial [Blastosporella zonata]
MHIARSSYDGRDAVPLDARALIELPIPLPSIPILNPILTPIIGGTNKPATTPATPTITPAPVTTATPASTSTPLPTMTASAGTGDSGDTNSSSSDSGIQSQGAITSAIGGSTVVSSNTSAGSSTQPSDGSTNDGSISGSDYAVSSAGSSSDSGNQLNVPVANAGGSVNNNPTSDDSGSKVGTSGSPGGLQPSSGATVSSGGALTGSTALSEPNGATNTGSPNATDNSSGLSSGAIAGIVVVLVLILLAIAVIIFRKRHIHRRTERWNQWWARAGSGWSSDSDGGSPGSPNRSNGRASARSSFATTFDYAQTPRRSMSFGDVPPLPPMAELRRGNDELPLFSPNSAIADSPILVTFDRSQVPGAASSRTSVHSVESHISGAQYIYVPHGILDGQGVTTPMSVRPFSPSESFAFPKPPTKQSGDWSSSRPLSSNTFYSASQSITDSAPAVPSNPFSDPVLPFAEFAELESIRRPFASTRDDELSVSVSDSVRVLKLFDDGWALVEKLPSFEDLLKKEYDSTSSVQGLIPIDCFRAEGQDLSSFFSEKRVASALYNNRASSISYKITAV